MKKHFLFLLPEKQTLKHFLAVRERMCSGTEYSEAESRISEPLFRHLANTKAGLFAKVVAALIALGRQWPWPCLCFVTYGCVSRRHELNELKKVQQGMDNP